MSQRETPRTVSPVSWAIAGFGAGGRVFHAPLIRDAANLRLSAVVASTKHQARFRDDAALRHVQLVSSLDDLPKIGVQGVTITTPAGTHVELAHQALDLGLHVVVDKPFALTAADARGLVEHAHRAGRMLTVYQNRRWDGDLLTIKAIVDSRELGTVHRFYSRIQRFKPSLPEWNTAFPASQGGGTLVDLGPHLIDQAVFLFGRVVSVSAELDRVGSVGGVGGGAGVAGVAGVAGAENDVLLSLVHEGGVRSLLEASVVAGSAGVRFQLNAEHGGVTLDGFDIQEADLFAGRTPASLGASWGTEPAERRAIITRAGSAERRPVQNGSWNRYYPAVAAAVLGSGPVPVDPVDAVHTAEVIDAARHASAERRTTDLPRSGAGSP